MKKHIILLIIISSILFIWKIGNIPILDGDTAAAAKIAKNIVATGDWITMYPMEKGQIVSKPPLFYWIIAAGFKLFGVNEFGLSILHSIIGVLTVLATYLIAKELFSEKAAFWSGLILLTSAQFFYQARSPLYDMPLTFFITLALYCFVLFEKHKKYIYYYLIPVFTALAVLIKGPVGLVLVGLVLFVYTIWNKTFFKHLNFRLVLVIVLFLAVAAPWFIAEYKILGQPFLNIMASSNFGRFFHPTDSIGNDPTINTAIPQYDFYSYFLQLFILFVPWSGFLYPALFSEIKKKENRFIISWALGIIIFFSLSLNYKISRYILPAYPALAIIVAKFLEEIDIKSRAIAVSKWLTAGLIIPLLIIGTAYMILSFPVQQAAYQPIVLPFIIIFTAGMVISTVFLFKNELEKAMKGFVIGSIIAYLVLIPCLNIFFIRANPIKDFCQIINKENDGLAILYKADSSAHFAGFYLNDDFVQTREQKNIKKLLKTIPRVYIISEDPKAAEEFKNIKIVGQISNFVLFSN